MDFAIEYITTVFDSMFEYAIRLYEYFDLYTFIYGLFFIFVVVKFLLIPIFGGAISAGSSDIAADIKESRKHKGNDQKRIEMKR